MFTFKVWDHIKKAWPIYKAHFGLLLLLAAVTAIVKAVGTEDSWLLIVLCYIVGFLLGYIWFKYSLGLVDGKEHDLFTKKALPTLEQYWNLTKTMILSFLMVFGGLILLVFPGLYFAGRISFAVFISVEKNQGAMKSIAESWCMTKNNSWRLFWKGLLIQLFILLGLVAFGVGLLITLPIGNIVFAMMYREYQKYQNAKSQDEDDNKEDEEKETEVEQVKAEKIN